VKPASSTAWGRITTRVDSCAGWAARGSATTFVQGVEGQFLEPFVRDRGHLEDLVAARLQIRLDHLREVAPPRPARRSWFSTIIRGRSANPAPYAPQFRLDHVEVGQRVPVRLQRRGVQHVHQHRASLHVPQELEARARAPRWPPGSARARPRWCRRSNRPVTTPEVRHQRGERNSPRSSASPPTSTEISEDLPRSGSHTSATSATVLSSSTTSRASPGSPSSAKAGRLAAGRGQRRVAEAAAARPAPATYVVPCPTRSASTSPAAVQHDRAVRHRQYEVGTVLAGAVAALPRLAVGGLAVRAVVVVQQRGDGPGRPPGSRRRPGRRCRRPGPPSGLNFFPVYGGAAVAPATPRRHAARRGPRRWSWVLPPVTYQSRTVVP